MSANDDSELVASITPDVMTCLNRARFFEQLDDVLCPVDGSAPQCCTGNHSRSQNILATSGFDQQEVAEVIAVLESLGGCCDCEVLYNVAETSRLKTRYWKTRTQDATSHHPHPPKNKH